VTLVLYWTAVPPRLRRYSIIIAGCVFYAYAVPAYLVLVLALGAITSAIAGRIVASRRRPAEKRAWMVAGVTLIVAVLAFFKDTKFFAATIDDVARRNVLPIPSNRRPAGDLVLHVVDRADPCLPESIAVPVAAVAALGRSLAVLGAGALLDLELHQTLGDMAEELAHDFVLSPLFNELGECHTDLGHRGVLSREVALQKQPSPGATVAALYPTRRPGSYTTPWDTIWPVRLRRRDTRLYSQNLLRFQGILRYRHRPRRAPGPSIPENFDRPYWAQNISEFWHRWHISLSSWIRDYIFIPLVGSRRRPLITGLNLFIAIAAGGTVARRGLDVRRVGLWHGGGLAVHRLWSQLVVPRWQLLTSGGPAIRATSLVPTFAFVVLGWILFAATSFKGAGETLGRALLR
jgi:hypothetical protein